jgi:hypothetical protein
VSFAHIENRISEPRSRRAWRDDSGMIYATVEIGATTLYLDSAADARAIAAACIEAAKAIERLADGGQA